MKFILSDAFNRFNGKQDIIKKTPRLVTVEVFKINLVQIKKKE